MLLNNCCSWRKMCGCLPGWSSQLRKLWSVTAFVFFLGPSFVAGIKMSPCSSDGVWEVPANQETRFTCTAEGPVLWRLRTETPDPIAIAAYDGKGWTLWRNFSGLFTPSTIDTHRTSMTINPVNNTKLYEGIQLVNGSLECSSGNVENKSARCQLNYVFPSENVSCSTTNSSWSVFVSCDIASVYSSRKDYTCQVIRQIRYKDELRNETLKTVTMVTSPTSEEVAKNEVKMSGSCQLDTTLPAKEGNYSFYVSVSPGTQMFAVAHREFSVEPPTSPDIVCDPQPFVRENTDVICTCSTTHLGWPAGSLRLVKRDLQISEKWRPVTKEEQDFTLRELQYTHTLNLSDHNRTQFRCSITWGTEEIGGQIYTANVGFGAKTPELFLNDKKENHSAVEPDQVQVRCESEGRPTPNVTVSIKDNNTVVWKCTSPVNFTFIARCEDTATYTCSAWNEFSAQTDVTPTVSLSLDVACKPRNVSGTTDLGNVSFGKKSKEVNFEVIAYPVPSVNVIWLGGPAANSNPSYEKVESPEMNATCKPDTKKRYLSKCILTIFTIPSPGLYKVQVINEHGDENFTLVITCDKKEKEEEPRENHLVTFGSVGAVLVLLILAITAFVFVNRNRKKDFSRLPRAGLSTNSRHLDNNRRPDEGSQPLQPAEIIYEIPWDSVRTQNLAVQVAAGMSKSQADPFLTPLYAVVDKTKKKAKKQGTEATDVFEEQSQQNANVIYAVVDKARSKTPAKRAQNQTVEKDHKPKKSQWKKLTETYSWCNDNNSAYYENSANLAMHALPSQNQTSGQDNPYSLAAGRHEHDDGRWENDDGLIYTLPVFDVRNDVRRPPAPRSEETEYCTLRGIETKFPALDKN